MYNVFLRERGKANNRVESLQEKAARQLVTGLPEGASMGYANGQMIDRARAKSWARESVQSRMIIENLTAAENYYWNLTDLTRDLQQNGWSNAELMKKLHYLSHPVTHQVFMQVKRSHQEREQPFTDYETMREREFRQNGTQLDRRFVRYVDKVLNYPYSIQPTREDIIRRIARHLGVSETAATAILADLVDTFESTYDIPALL